MTEREIHAAKFYLKQALSDLKRVEGLIGGSGLTPLEEATGLCEEGPLSKYVRDMREVKNSE